MSLVYRSGIALLILSFVLAMWVGKVDVAGRLTLADAPKVLDISSDLSANFKRMGTAEKSLVRNLEVTSTFKDVQSYCELLPFEGIDPHKAHGLESVFSEVEVYSSSAPYQVIFAYYTIAETPDEQAKLDAFMKDEELLMSMAWDGTTKVACGEITGNVSKGITYPDIGDAAVLASGRGTSYTAAWVGYDILVFKKGKVYVFVASGFVPSTETPILPLVEKLEKQMAPFAL